MKEIIVTSQAELDALHRRRICAARNPVRTVAVDAALVGVILMAVVVLLVCAVS